MAPEPDLTDTFGDPDALRLDAATVQAIRDQHDAKQQDHGYERCEHCWFTRHPCDTYDLATDWLTMHTQRR